MANYLAPKPVTLKHTAEIGLVVVNWNLLELSMNYLIAAMLRLKGLDGHLVTADMGFRQKLDLLQVLEQRSLFPNEIHELHTDLFKLLRKAQSTRNLIVHAQAWVKGEIPNSIAPCRLRVRGKIIVQGYGQIKRNMDVNFTPERLRDIAVELRKGAHAIRYLTGLYQEALADKTTPNKATTKSRTSASEGNEPPK